MTIDGSTSNASSPDAAASTPAREGRHFPCLVTTMFARRVRAGMEEAYEQWMRGITAEACNFPGYLGTTVLRPRGEEQPQYIVIINFGSGGELESWMHSEARAAWLKRAEPLTVDDEEAQTITGLERWFTLPSRAVSQPPPRYKMAVLTVVGLFPLLVLLQLVLTPVVEPLPHWLRLLVSVLVAVPLMTYAVMPVVTWAFFRWLYPGSRSWRATPKAPPA